MGYRGYYKSHPFYESSFKSFKRMIKEKGGVWQSEDVYFFQTRDTYSAEYLPEFPRYSERDLIVEENHTLGLTMYYKRDENLALVGMRGVDCK